MKEYHGTRTERLGSPLMRHEISYRELSLEELRRLRPPVRAGIKPWIDDFLFVPVLILGGFFVLGMLLATVAGWLLSQTIGWSLPGWAVAGLLIVCGIIGVAIGVSAGLDFRRHRRLRAVDIAARRVEVVRVEGARLVEQEVHNDEGPLYFFGIGSGRILFLGGQWLLDYDIYGLDPDPAAIEADDWIPFPSSSFVVHRLPASGEVLRIELGGDRLPPEAVLSRKATLPSGLSHRFRQGLCGDSFLADADFSEFLPTATSSDSTK